MIVNKRRRISHSSLVHVANGNAPDRGCTSEKTKYMKFAHEITDRRRRAFESSYMTEAESAIYRSDLDAC